MLVVYDDFERDEAPLTYFFRGPDSSRPGAAGARHLPAGWMWVRAPAAIPWPSGPRPGGHRHRDPAPLVRASRDRGVRDTPGGHLDGRRGGAVRHRTHADEWMGLTETLPGLRRFFRRLDAWYGPGDRCWLTPTKSACDGYRGGAGPARWSGPMGATWGSCGSSGVRRAERGTVSPAIRRCRYAGTLCPAGRVEL